MKHSANAHLSNQQVKYIKMRIAVINGEQDSLNITARL